MVEKLEGLSAEDRQLWEQKYQDRLAGKAPEEIERLWRDSRFVKKYKNTPEYKWMAALPAEERDRIYNQDYINQTNATNALNTPMTIDMGGKAVQTNQKVSPKNFSIESPAVASPNPATKKLAQETLDVQNFTKDPATQKAIDDYQTAEQQYVKANPEYQSSEWYKRQAIKLAEEKSPVYKKYKEYEWFNPSDEQWGNALKKYEVDKSIYGEEDAAERLNNDLMKIASEQEPYYRKGALAFQGMGAQVLGGLSVVGGMALATPEAVYNAAKNVIVDDQGIRFDQAFINTLISHPAVTYGTKVTQYGTLNTDRMKYIDEELGGLSDTGFAKDPEGGIFTENLPFELLQQYGSTALSMGLSAGASAALNGVVRGVAQASANKLSKKLAGDLLKKKLAESAIKYNTLNSVLQATTVPLFVASFESGMNGYQAKEQIFNELNQKNLEAYMAKVNSDVAEQELMLNLNRGAAEGQSFVSDAERQLMQENAKRKYLPEYLQGEAHAEALAIQAASSQFYTTSFVNGAANATLLRGLQAPRVQNALNNSKLFSKVSKVSKFMKPTTTASGTIGAATVKTVTPTWQKVGAVLKQPAGEYLEEYLPAVEGMATADAKSYNMTQFLDKSYNSDIELEIGQAMEGQHEAFMRGVGEALVSEEANTQGVYGALSSIMGGPMMRMGDYRTSTVDREGNMTSKFSLARREGEGKLEYATRLMPWQSGVTMEVRAQINQARAAKKEAELLQQNLNDPELASRLQQVKTSMAWGKDMGDAAEAGDEFAYRNSEQGRAIQDAILLNKIKDTDLGKAHVSTMKRQAQMEMNSPDAAQYIKEVKANPDNLSDGMTDEQIVEQGKKNATRYLENLEFVSKETELLNKQLGNVSDDVLSTLIYGRSQLQNWEKRAESLDKEITAVNIQNPTVSSPVNADQTNVLKQFGSHKNMVTKKLALEKGIKAREQQLKDYIKTHKKLTKPQLQAIDKYRQEIKARKEELKAINTLEKKVEGESLMNEHDILRAPADLRAHMLNPDNKNLFTSAQQKVIEKVVEQGLAHSPEFLTKVQDAGKISEAQGQYYSQYTKFLNNPGYLLSYAERARQNKENAVFENNAQKIANIDNYEMFSSELDDIFNAPTNSKAVITKATLDKVTKDNPNHFYHKYKKDRTDFMGVLNSAIRSNNNEELSEDDVAIVANAVKFLQANNIDLKDSSKIVEVMTAVDANGVNIFKDFMEHQPKTSLLATKEGTYTTPEDVITKLKFVLDKYNKEQEDLKSKNPEIVVKETPASANITPVVPVVEVPKAPNNVTPGSKNEQNETTEDGTPQTPAEVSAAAKETLRNGIKIVEKTVKAAPKEYSKNTKDRVMKDFSKINQKLQDSPSATLETLLSYISELQTNYTLLATNTSDADENTMYNEAGMLAQTIFNNLQVLNSKQQNSIFDKQYFDYESVDRVQSPDAASIEILNIAYLKRRFSSVGTPILTYLNIYKVEEFLARNFKQFDPNGKTKIKFMYDPKLATDVQSSMENAGKEYDLNAVPIVAVTQVSKKTPTSIEIEEGGKTVYYQPIGILPSTTNPYAQGANRTKYLREQLPVNFSKLTNPTLLVDEKGDAISTTFSSKIHAKSPEKTNDRNIADVIVGQLNNTPENEKLKSLNKKDRLKSPLYKSIRDAFIKRFVTVKPDDSSTRLAFTQSNLNFGDDNDVKHQYVIVNNGGDITKIEERNSDTKLVDLFLQENVNKEDAINSNSRVEKFAFKLKQFIQKDFSKHTISVTVNSETGEVSATDSAAEIKKLEESLTNSLNHVIFAKGSWTYTITPTNQVDANNNRLFNLSLTNQEGKDITIPLGQISKSALSIDSQFEILQNIFKAANAQQAEFKFQVDYSDANIINSETATPEQKKIAFKNMQEMFDDGLFYINQTSTEFQITGFTMNSPYTKDGELLKTKEVVTAPTITDKIIVSPNGEKVDSDTMVAETKTVPTETKDAEVNKLLQEQQKHSILFKLSDDSKYYINTKTGEQFINLDYNEQDASKQDIEGFKKFVNGTQETTLKIVETTNIISQENTRIAAQYDKINNQIKIDRQLLRQKYQEKAWTNPRKLIEIIDGTQIESSVQPLPIDQFKTYEEWEQFVINHEYQHSVYSREDFNKEFPNKNKVDYESEINRRALQQLNDQNNLNSGIQQKQDITPVTTQIDTKKLQLSLQMLGLNNLKKNFKIGGQVQEGKNSFKVISKADFIATTPDGKVVLILDATKHVDNIEEKLNMQKELLEQNAKFKVATLYKADVNGKLTEVPILNSKEMAELNKNKIKQLNKSEQINIEEEKSPSIVTKPVTVEDKLQKKANEDNQKPTTKEANTNNSTQTLEDMVAGLDMFADLGIAEDLMTTPTSSISEFDWNNLKNLVQESGETVNEAEVKKMLESTGITEQVWNNMTDQMRKNTLKCKGFL